MTTEEIIAKLESGVMRFGDQQKSLLSWMLEQESHKTFLLDDPSTIDAYTPTEIAWSSRGFLGHSPTESERSVISRMLSNLEKDQLITLKGREKKNFRTTHVMFTALGRLIAEGLQKGYTVGKTSMTKRTSTTSDLNRATAFDISRNLVKRDLDRVEDALKSDIRDYASWRIVDVTGKVIDTRSGIETYQSELKKVAETFDLVRAELDEQFNDKLLQWLRAGDFA